MTWLDEETQDLISNLYYEYKILVTDEIVIEEWNICNMGCFNDENYCGLVCALIAKSKGWD